MDKDNKSKLEHETPAPLERNTKIMVNWEKKLLISTDAPTNTQEYQRLITLGYDEVGEYKPRRNAFFWLDKFFSIGHKYFK